MNIVVIIEHLLRFEKDGLQSLIPKGSLMLFEMLRKFSTRQPDILGGTVFTQQKYINFALLRKE